MPIDPVLENRYRQRLARYTQALRNEQPDCVPIRPFAAEFAAKYAGLTCQDVTQDYEQAFAAVRRCASDFDWDAVVANMVYVWAGLTQALGLRYYAIPGVELGPNVGFQYREPPESDAFMRGDEYDALIADPTGFLCNVWLPRVSKDIVAPGTPATDRSHLAFLKGGMALLQYFTAFGPQVTRLRSECGMPSAIAGILKAPLDILGDKLRGYLGLTRDLRAQPKKVLAACEALMPHLLHIARTSADPLHQAPIGFWMHRGCVPFVTPAQFESHYWTTLRPIIEELWRGGHQTLFYAEGDWDHHLDRFAELPERSIVYHVDRGDLSAARRKLGHKFCLSGGLPNTVLSYGTPAEVRTACQKVLDAAAHEGGYIFDASAIIQNDAQVENVRAMTEYVREHGVYPRGHAAIDKPGPAHAEVVHGNAANAAENPVRGPKPGVCIPWDRKRGELCGTSGNPAAVRFGGDELLVQRVWEGLDGWAHTFIWHCLVSF